MGNRIMFNFIFMKMINSVAFVCLLLSCSSNKIEHTNTNREKKAASFYSCELIEKEFVNKIGKSNGVKELYLRCSVQDYFIKICESNVTAEQLKKHLNRGIKVEIEIKNGSWDICEYTLEQQQSRIGEYIVVSKIID